MTDPQVTAVLKGRGLNCRPLPPPPIPAAREFAFASLRIVDVSDHLRQTQKASVAPLRLC